MGDSYLLIFVGSRGTSYNDKDVWMMIRENLNFGVQCIEHKSFGKLGLDDI